MKNFKKNWAMITGSSLLFISLAAYAINDFKESDFIGGYGGGSGGTTIDNTGVHTEGAFTVDGAITLGTVETENLEIGGGYGDGVDGGLTVDPQGDLETDGDITADGTITGDVTGDLTGNVSGTTVTATGEVNAGNIDANAGTIETTGALESATLTTTGLADVGSLDANAGTIETTGALESATLTTTGLADVGNLEVGGGYGDVVDGGATISATGAFTTDGAISTPTGNITTTTGQISAATALIGGYNVAPQNITFGLSDVKQKFDVINTGGQLYFETENLAGGNIIYNVNGGIATLDCLTGSGTGGKARVALVEGASASAPALNYIYVTSSGSVASLNASITMPTGSFAWVGAVSVPDDTTFDTTGVYMSQRYTEAYNHSGRGALSYARERIRAQGVKWIYNNGLTGGGLVPTATVTTNGGSLDNLQLGITTGTVFQLHRQTWPVFPDDITGVGNETYYYGNNANTPYASFTDLNTALFLQDGTTAISDKRYNLVIWAVMSANDADCKIYVNLPSGTYNNDADCIADTSNYSDYSVSNDIGGSPFMLCRLAMRHRTSSGGTLTVLETIDLRGTPVGVRTGTVVTAPASSEFSDDVFIISDDGDASKQIAFEASGITTSTKRTFTAPDVNGTLGVIGDLELFDMTNVAEDATLANGDLLIYGLGLFQNQPMSGDGTIDEDGVFGLAPLSVDSGNYVWDSIDNEHIADDAIDSDELAGGAVDAAHLATDAVTHTAILADAVRTDEIQANAITEAKMSANSVDSDSYVDDSIDTAHYAPLSVDNTAMAANSIDSDNYVDDSIDAAHYAAGSVDVTAIGPDAVGNSELQNSLTITTIVGSTYTATGKIKTTDVFEGDSVHFLEAAAPSTPASSYVVVYAKTDGAMYFKDDAGTETAMAGGGGGGSKEVVLMAGQASATTTGGIAVSSIEEMATNDVDVIYGLFDPDTDTEIFFNFVVPDGWSDTSSDVTIMWYPPGSESNNTVYWQVRSLSRADNESLDAAFNSYKTVAGDGTGQRKLQQTTVTDLDTSLWNPGELVVLQVRRYGTTGSDDFTGDASFVSVTITEND